MVRLSFVALGGAFGALSRYFVSGVVEKYCNGFFPWGTLSVNVLGSLLAGLLWGLLENVIISPNVRIFIFIGVLGAFTTFSTFSLETFHLLRDAEYRLALTNILLNNILSIVFVFVGFFASKYLVNILK